MNVQKLSESELTEWLEGELRLIEVSPVDSIAERGLIGAIAWKEIGWRAAIRYTERREIPEEWFDGLDRFGDLIGLIQLWHGQVAPRIEVLAVA